MCFPLGITMETVATEPLSDHNRSSGVSEGDTDYVEMDPSRRYGRYKEVLGKGAFKKVYRAFDEVEGIEVAWNQVKIEDATCIPEELERLQSEIHLLRTLRHKNVIKFYHSWVDKSNQNINFITEIFTSGTLRQYRKKHKHVDLKAEKNWARQILRGLLYLHSHDPPIIHRDLKCDNIFINGNHGEVKIGDLGLATILQQAHAAHSVIGTPEFMAPELYEEDYNELADIYSFGMCLLEMVTSEYPYSECANAAQIYKKVTSGIKPAALERVKDSEVRQFIEKCLAPVSRRLPARELLADSFLRLDESSREAQECPPLPKQLQANSANNASLAKSDSEKAMCSMGISSIEGSSDKGLTPPSNDQDKDDKDKDAQDKELIFSSEFSTEEQLKSRDFKVKGKKKDDNTVFLRIRIADTEGNIRNIHFLFDLVGDSALSVASEMVEELDLSGQVVTTIADMIDSEIIALVPKWKPGVSLDETPPVLENPQSNKVTLEGSMESNCITTIPPPLSYALVERLSPLRNSTLRLKPSLASPSAIRGGEATTMFGRFEEVTYNKGEPEVLSSSLSSPHIRLAFSSDSSEMCGDEEGMSSSNELAESKRETVRKAATSCCVRLGLSDEEEADLNEELQILKNKQGEELRELERRYRSSIIDLHSRWRRKGNNSKNNNPSNESITLVDEMVRSGSVTDQGRTSLDLDISSSSDNNNNNMLGNGNGERSFYHDIRQAALSRFLSDASSLANNGASNNDNTITYSNPERDNIYTGKSESKQNESDCIHERHVEE